MMTTLQIFPLHAQLYRVRMKMKQHVCYQKKLSEIRDVFDLIAGTFITKLIAYIESDGMK
jgi:hypothetical protein